MAHICFNHLTKRYGPIVAVDDFTVTLQPGKITGFLGPNGAGKSTTLRMLVGLTTPSGGTATIDGLPYPKLSHPSRAIGAVTDSAVFHPRRSGRDALRVLCALGGIPSRRADEVIDLVELMAAGGRNVGGYSMGMRQRLALAAALLGDPETLVLDEPATGLDPAGVLWLRTLLRGLAEQGRTVLVSSHLLAEAAQTVDDVIVINRGRLIVHGPMSQLIDDSHATSLEELFFDLVAKGASL
jgi:ABC-2 type transport system ATP-binding protein